MDTKHPAEEDLVLFAFGEAGDVGPIGPHVERCASCQAVLRDVQRTLRAVDAHQIPERGPSYGAETWARIQPRLGPPPVGSWRLWFAPTRLVYAAGVAILLVAAFFAGRYSLRVPPPERAGILTPAPPAPANAAATPVRDPVLLVAVGDHLERSQMVLVELMNQPADNRVDISEAQERARALVPANRLIRQTADEAGELMVADVLDAVERALVEVANGPSHLSGADFRRIRDRIEAQDIVFRIRVLDSQVRQREDAAWPRARS